MIRFDDASLAAERSTPGEILSSSRAGGWHSMLLYRYREAGIGAPFDTAVTSDQTIVVTLRGCSTVEAFAGGRWHRGVCMPGSVGLSYGGQENRLRVSHASAAAATETAHLFMPTAFLSEAAEHYRRAGQRLDGAPLTALSYRDPAVAAAIGTLVAAMESGMPDLYPETMARWLAVHLLSRHSGWRIDFGEERDPGVLRDARLARVIEFMSAYLTRPLTLTELAQEAAVSVHHFGKLFRAATGTTPLRYLLDLRLEAARRLLATTDLPIQEIACAAGFHPRWFLERIPGAAWYVAHRFPADADDRLTSITFAIETRSQ